MSAAADDEERDADAVKGAADRGGKDRAGEAEHRQDGDRHQQRIAARDRDREQESDLAPVELALHPRRDDEHRNCEGGDPGGIGRVVGGARSR